MELTGLIHPHPCPITDHRRILLLVVVFLSAHHWTPVTSLICFNCLNCNDDPTDTTTCNAGVTACASGYGYMTNGTRITVRACSTSEIGMNPVCKFVPGGMYNGNIYVNVTACICNTDRCNRDSLTITTTTTTTTTTKTTTTTRTTAAPTTTRRATTTAATTHYNVTTRRRLGGAQRLGGGWGKSVLVVLLALLLSSVVVVL